MLVVVGPAVVEGHRERRPGRRGVAPEPVAQGHRLVARTQPRQQRAEIRHGRIQRTHGARPRILPARAHAVERQDDQLAAVQPPQAAAGGIGSGQGGFQKRAHATYFESVNVTLAM